MVFSGVQIFPFSSQEDLSLLGRRGYSLNNCDTDNDKQIFSFVRYDNQKKISVHKIIQDGKSTPPPKKKVIMPCSRIQYKRFQKRSGCVFRIEYPLFSSFLKRTVRTINSTYWIKYCMVLIALS